MYNKYSHMRVLLYIPYTWLRTNKLWILYICDVCEYKNYIRTKRIQNVWTYTELDINIIVLIRGIYSIYIFRITIC